MSIATAANFVAAPNPRFFRTTSPTSNSTTTLANVTGALWPVSANKNYTFVIYAICTSTATGTGFRFALDVPAGTTVTLMFSNWTSTGGGVSAGGQRADAASIGFTSGVDATAANVMVPIIGSMLVGATAGSAQLMHASETAVSTTVVEGTMGMLFEEP